MLPSILRGNGFILVFATTTLYTVQASAEKDDRPLAMSAGGMLFAGGNLFTTPDNIPSLPSGKTYEGIGFAGSAGGFGWGIGPYFEARFVQHLGVHAGLVYDQSTLTRTVTINNTVDITERVTMSSLRIPILFKGIVPAPFGRVWAGLGPEFIVPMSVDAENEITKNADLVAPADRTRIENLINAQEASSTMLAFGLGFAFAIGEVLELPVELRAAKNLSQDSDWLERVDIPSPTDPNPNNAYTVTAQSSWDFRLGIGLGARF